MQGRRYSQQNETVKGGIEFYEFGEKACGNTMNYRYKNVDEVLSKF